MDVELPPEIRITDPPTRRLVAKVQKLRQESTGTSTVRNLIRERAMQLGVLDQPAPAGSEEATEKDSDSPAPGQKPVGA